MEFTEADEGQAPRAYVVCRERDDIGRVAVPLERLNQWRPDLTALARWTAAEVGTGDQVEEVAEGRLWWLGRPRLGNRPVDVFLAVGVGPADSIPAAALARIRESTDALVLVPGQVPTEARFGTAAKVACLSRLISLGPVGLSLDRRGMEAAVGKGRPTRRQTVAPFDAPPDTTWEQLLIEFQNDEVVKISVGSAVDHKTFADMGFADRRKTEGQPDVLWVFLRELAGQEGELAWTDNTGVPERNRHKAKKWVSDIRARLQAYFPSLAGDPFKSYRRAGAYRTRFVLRWSDFYRHSRR